MIVNLRFVELRVCRFRVHGFRVHGFIVCGIICVIIASTLRLLDFWSGEIKKINISKTKS